MPPSVCVVSGAAERISLVGAEMNFNPEGLGASRSWAHCLFRDLVREASSFLVTKSDCCEKRVRVEEWAARTPGKASVSLESSSRAICGQEGRGSAPIFMHVFGS